MQTAFSWKSLCWSASAAVLTISSEVATHCRNVVVRVQIGQSPPHTMRSQPKHSILLDVGAHCFGGGVAAFAISKHAGNLVRDVRQRGKLAHVITPRIESAAGDVGHTAVIEDELHVRVFLRQIPGDQELPCEKTEVESESTATYTTYVFHKLRLSRKLVWKRRKMEEMLSPKKSLMRTLLTVQARNASADWKRKK